MALLVFAISLVGLVGLQSRSVETERAANEVREGQKIAAEVMSELQSRSFCDLLLTDFEGGLPASLAPDQGYTDAGVDLNDPVLRRLRGYARPPMGSDPGTGNWVGVDGKYVVFRRVTWQVDPLAAPPYPPVTEDDYAAIFGLNLEVLVLWVDQTSSNSPPPVGLLPTTLTPAMIQPGDPNFPFVGRVSLTNFKTNDVATPPCQP